MTVAIPRPERDEGLLLPSDEEFRRLQQDGSVHGYEMENGKLVPMAPVYGGQSTIWGELFYAVRRYLEEHPEGKSWLDLYVVLDPRFRRWRYFPDLSYLASDVVHRYDGEKIVGPPNMVCEVSTEHSRERDYGAKKTAYGRFGVEWYWLADTVKEVTREYRVVEGVMQEQSVTPFREPFRPALFPGLEVVLQK